MQTVASYNRALLMEISPGLAQNGTSAPESGKVEVYDWGRYSGAESSLASRGRLARTLEYHARARGGCSCPERPAQRGLFIGCERSKHPRSSCLVPCVALKRRPLALSSPAGGGHGQA